MGRNALNTLFTRALSLVQEQAPPPPITQIADFIGELVAYDRVVTSAMHVFIVCQSYGVPCSLVTFEGFEDNVHGTGLKYGDYAQGVGLDPVSPVVVPLDLSSFSFANIERDDVVSEAKKDEIVDAIRRGIAIVESRR
jgi:hypothetical protein